MEINKNYNNIWDFIKKRIPHAEQYEAESLIGPDLIEQLGELSSELESFTALTAITINNNFTSKIHPNSLIEYSPTVLVQIEAFLKHHIYKSEFAENNLQTVMNSEGEVDDNISKMKTDALTGIRKLIKKETQAMESHLKHLQEQLLSKVFVSNEVCTTQSNDFDRADDEKFSDENNTNDDSMASKYSHVCDRCASQPSIHSSAKELKEFIGTIDLVEQPTKFVIECSGDSSANTDDISRERTTPTFKQNHDINKLHQLEKNTKLDEHIKKKFNPRPKTLTGTKSLIPKTKFASKIEKTSRISPAQPAKEVSCRKSALFTESIATASGAMLIQKNSKSALGVNKSADRFRRMINDSRRISLTDVDRKCSEKNNENSNL